MAHVAKNSILWVGGRYNNWDAALLVVCWQRITECGPGFYPWNDGGFFLLIFPVVVGKTRPSTFCVFILVHVRLRVVEIEMECCWGNIYVSEEEFKA